MEGTTFFTLDVYRKFSTGHMSFINSIARMKRVKRKRTLQIIFIAIVLIGMMFLLPGAISDLKNILPKTKKGPKNLFKLEVESRAGNVINES